MQNNRAFLQELLILLKTHNTTNPFGYDLQLISGENDRHLSASSDHVEGIIDSQGILYGHRANFVFTG